MVDSASLRQDFASSVDCLHLKPSNYPASMGSVVLGLRRVCLLGRKVALLHLSAWRWARTCFLTGVMSQDFPCKSFSLTPTWFLVIFNLDWLERKSYPINLGKCWNVSLKGSKVM